MDMRITTGKIAQFPRKKFEAFLGECKVQTKDFGLQPFRLLGTQKYVLDEIEKAVAEGKTSFVILKARQLGMTTLIMLLDLFWAFNYPGLVGAIAIHNDQGREQMRNVVETFFTHLPNTHKVRKSAHNRMMLILKNGSQFLYLVAGTREKQTAGLGRGSAFNYAHLSEVAYWGTENDLLELEATMSQHYPHRLQIIETTANGYNFFKDVWDEACGSQVTHPIFVGWWLNELYAFNKDDPRFRIFMPDGDETKLHVLERKRVREVKEEYGFDIKPGQIAWYRWQLEEKQRNDQTAMDEKFPWTASNAFVASGAKFFGSETLTDNMREAHRLLYMPFKYSLGEDWTETGINDATKQRGREDLRVWELADPAGHYVIGCDPAFGSSESADRSTIHVARCFADRLHQVAEFCSSSALTYHCAWILCHLAGYYRNSMVNLEIQGPGTAVFQEMLHLKRQSIRSVLNDGSPSNLRDIFASTAHYLYRRPDSMRGELAYQWRTTHDNKHSMMCSFRDSYQLGRFKIASMDCLEEMRSMIYDEGSVYAESRKHDDRVMAAGLAHEAWKRWVQPKLLARNFTYKQYTDEKAGQKQDVAGMAVNRHIDYLRRLGKVRVGRFY